MILHEIHAEGMILSETFQVAAIIEKLPPAWKDFKNYLKYKRKEMNVEELIVRLRIEEDNKSFEKKWFNPGAAKANIVEHGQGSKNYKIKVGPSGGKGIKLGPKGGIPKKKFQGKCFNCDKVGHKFSEYRLPKKKKEVNVVDYMAHDVSEISLTAVISEVNMVGSNPKEWWIDTGATRHVCSDKELYTTFEVVENGEKLFMGNSATSEIKGQGKVVLKMTLGKELTLNNVLYVPKISKNLVSRSLLNKHGFRIVFESDKVILSKSGMFVEKYYVSDEMFKFNVMVVKPKMNNKVNASVYLLESSNVWHGRLGHVNYDTLRRLVNLKCIPAFHVDSKHKCETCVEAKLTRSSFKSIERNMESFDLIHSDICDLKIVQTRGGNKYFITFVDDSTKYCYVYLLKSKDEMIEKFVLYKNEVENQLNKKIKVLRSDRGGEYEAPFAEFSAQHGIIHETTALYSSQQNGVAERKNRTLKEMMNAMLVSSGLHQNMWGDAVLSVNYLLNMVPRKKMKKTPYELWKESTPSYKYLRVWECHAKVAVPTPKKVKICLKTVDCIFIGYAHNSSTCRFLVYESKIQDIHRKTIMESRNASFFEHVFPCRSEEEANSSKRTYETMTEHSQDQELEEEVEVEPRRSCSRIYLFQF